MKIFGIIFDVSGSMKKKFQNINKFEKINKKSDELTEIMKNICKNNQMNIFAILYGLLESPFIIDFIRLLKLTNNKLEKISDDNENSNSTYFREKLIDYLSTDKNGQKRYCNIKKYVLSEDGPSEKLSEFFCNIMKEEREIIDTIYYSLPKEVTNRFSNNFTNTKITVAKGAEKGIEYSKKRVVALAGKISSLIIYAFDEDLSENILNSTINYTINHNINYVDNRVKTTEKEETIKAIENSFVKCIQIITKKILNKYNEEKKEEYEIIKGQEIIRLIEEIEKKIIPPKNKKINIIDIFENIIYGNTPLYTSCIKAFSILEKNYNNDKFLLIISDGLLNDIQDLEKSKNDIKQKIEQLHVTVICIYLNCSNVYNEKRFYNDIQPNFDEGAQFLFNISSKIDYHNNILKFFIKNNWKVPPNGICNLFIEINNSKDLNLFIDLLNKSLEKYNDPLDEINTIIGDAFLDRLVYENYKFDAKDQDKKPECWAYAISTSIYLSSIRVFGRKIKSFDNIKKEVIKIKNDKYPNIVVKKSNFEEIVSTIVSNFSLKAKKIEPDEARISIMKGRQCLCYFWLFKEEMNNLNMFFLDKKNKKKIITRKKIMSINNKNNKNIVPKGHVVVLISIEENCLKILNSYGKDYGDNGYFRIKDHKSLRDMQFIEIYWKKSDLTEKEIYLYNYNYLSFIKEASNYLSKPNSDIKNDLEQKVECPICKKQLNLNNFELIFNQKNLNEQMKEVNENINIINEENDEDDKIDENDKNETDMRKLKIKCQECNKIFESDSITTLLYIYNLLN